MNVQRKIILTVSFAEILRDLKANNPSNLQVQALPDNVKGVGMEGGSGGVTITWTTVIGDRE